VFADFSDHRSAKEGRNDKKCQRAKEVRTEMPAFIVLGRFTQKGIENMKASPERLEAARKVARSNGGEIREFYYTMGRFDFVAVCEAPSIESMARSLSTISGAGAVRTETLPAIPADKAAEMLKGLP
jgi:uncharacterized protein with GYD domain